MGDASSSAPGRRTGTARGQRKWDFWGSKEWLWDVYERDSATIRRRTVSQLDLEPGDAVLDVGCGPGTNFELLREAVGPDGHVLGVDFSGAMTRRASERVAANGWANVDVVRGDATRPPLGAERFDGALATTAVSATSDVGATVDGVRTALKSNGRFAVYGIRTVPSGPARVLNPIVSRLYRAIGDWNAEEDVLDRLRRSFDDVTVVDEFALGTNYVAVASDPDRA